MPRPIGPERIRAVSEMYERNRSYIETGARWVTRNPQDADDLMQNIATALLTRESFRGESSEQTYLRKVIVTEAIALRRATMAEKRGHGAAALSLERIPDIYHPTVPSPEDVAISREISEAVRKAVVDDPIVMLRVEEFDYDEIATIMTKNVYSVKTRIRRWAERHPLLKQELGGQVGDTPRTKLGKSA